jgi:hypothetical protein
MKKAIRITISMLIIGCLLLGTGAIVKASEPGYEITENNAGVAITLDGNWATGEWEDSWIEYMDASVADERFCYKADANNGYAPEFLIDSADTTDDAGDIWQICIGIPGGGDFPLEGQNKIEIVGHENMTVYEGDGSGWVEIDSSAVTWADDMTIGDVPFDYEHWCVEMIIDKTSIGSALWNGAPPIGLRVAMYDATNATWVAWPPQSDPDIPEGWGQITGGAASIPESFGIAVVVILSSVAVVISFFFLRKRPKSRSLSSGKVGRTL